MPDLATSKPVEYNLPENCKIFSSSPGVIRLRAGRSGSPIRFLLVLQVANEAEKHRVGEIIMHFRQEQYGAIISTFSLDSLYRQPDRIHESLARTQLVLEHGRALGELLREVGLTPELRTTENAEAAVATLKLHAANFLANPRTRNRIQSGKQFAKATRLHDKLGRENWGMVCACSTAAIARQSAQGDLEAIYANRNSTRMQLIDELMLHSKTDLSQIYSELEDSSSTAHDIMRPVTNLMIKPFFFAGLWAKHQLFNGEVAVSPTEETRNLIRAVYMFESAVFDLSMLLSTLERHPEKLDSETAQTLEFAARYQLDYRVEMDLPAEYNTLALKLSGPLREIARTITLKNAERVDIIKKARRKFTKVTRNRLHEDGGAWDYRPFLR